ncbi:hypothetical protein SPSIL_040170 [Sporomusa silvacetica DSM 10669]|uniref:Acetylxylan esterase n=2 Tax=Sporomusa silvacetica TaxID=55504 RepID=A0ABZ3IQY1_9FIRM|nr:alpha/beta hydrolase family protein [Sporomusa silvacetica DSM 10669]
MKKLLAVILLAGGILGSMLFFQEKSIECRNSSAGGIQREQHGVLHLNVDSTVGEIMDHPTFAGFSRFLLPEETGWPNAGMKLREIAALLPYHSHIEVNTTVRVLNHMIDEASAGKRIFYDFYTEEQKQQDAKKRNTGLFFFRGKPGAPFAVVCPGGGFSYVGSIHEGFPYALEISEQGYNAFVIQYRVGSEQRAVEDLAAAIFYIFAHAEELGVSTTGYSLWGSSAGARMAADIGSFGVAAFGGQKLSKPTAVIMAYTGHSSYTKQDPPTFVVVGSNDGIAPPYVMKKRLDAMQKAGIDVEFHEYPGLGHGFGLGVGTSAEGWTKKAVDFWKRHFSET